jgi:hypothetical protein
MPLLQDHLANLAGTSSVELGEIVLACRKIIHYTETRSQKDTDMDAATLAATVAPPPSAIAPFPRSAVEAGLCGELIEAVKIEASIRGVALPAAPAQITKAAVHVDSLVVVCILCAVEPIVGFELSDSMVRAGGYVSAESALGHLLLSIEKEWMKRKGAKP